MSTAEPPPTPEARAGELLAADFLTALDIDTGMLTDLCNAAFESTPKGELLWAVITLAGVLVHEAERAGENRLTQIITGLRSE
jgi:hypothetical protein